MQSPTSALLVAVMSLLIFCNVCALCMTFLKFDVFIVATLLAGVGLSIEFAAQ